MITFRIYPDFPVSKRYYLVQIYDSRQKMLDAIEKIGGEKYPHPHTEACCLSYIPKPKIRKVGVLLFAIGLLSPNTVAHEIDHAVTNWIANYEPKYRRKTYSDFDADEFRADLVDRLTQQTWEILLQVQL